MPTLKELSIGRKDVFMVPPEHIQIDPEWNARTKTEALETHINELAASIAQVGVLQPITVRAKDGGYWITDGFCRIEAVKRAIVNGAEIASIPVRTEERFSNEADHVLSMLVRNDGKPLTSVEQAGVVKRLLALGWTPKMVQEKTGKSTNHIANLMLLNAAHPAVIEFVESDKISTNLALDVLKKNEGDQALDIIQKEVAKATAKGKKKATKRTVNKPKISWGKHGPVAFEHLKAICDKFNDTPTEIPDELTDLIVAGSEAVDFIDKMVK